MSSIDAVRLMAGYKHWANNALFSTLNSSTHIEESNDLRAIISTLNHIYVVDRIFQSHLQDVSHNYNSVNTTDQPNLLELSEQTKIVDQWYVDYADSVTEAELSKRIDFKYTNGEDGSMLRSEMIFHVVNHGTYHRGQVGVLMLQNSIAPERDLLTHYIRDSNGQ